MRYWWVNQSRCFDEESEEGVVQASNQMGPGGLRYRETVAGVRKGDIVVHYHKRRGIVAISKAKEDASGVIRLKNLGGLPYDQGWRFQTDYFFLENPISKADWISDLTPDENDPNWPVNANSNIKQAYFIPFDRNGYKSITRHAAEKLPRWAS